MSPRNRAPREGRAVREYLAERRARELDDATDAYGMRPNAVNLERLASARLSVGDVDLVDYFPDA